MWFILLFQVQYLSVLSIDASEFFLYILVDITETCLKPAMDKMERFQFAKRLPKMTEIFPDDCDLSIDISHFGLPGFKIDSQPLEHIFICLRQMQKLVKKNLNIFLHAISDF